MRFNYFKDDIFDGLKYKEAIYKIEKLLNLKEIKIKRHTDALKIPVCASTKRYVRPKHGECVFMKTKEGKSLLISGGSNAKIPGFLEPNFYSTNNNIIN